MAHINRTMRFLSFQGSSFLRLTTIPLDVYTACCFSILPSMDTNFLAFANSAVVNEDVQASVRVLAFHSFGSMPRSEIVGHIVILFLKIF